MKVYILMGRHIYADLIESYAATLDASLKGRLLEDYKHDYPKNRFEWEEQELEEK